MQIHMNFASFRRQSSGAVRDSLRDVNLRPLEVSYVSCWAPNGDSSEHSRAGRIGRAGGLADRFKNPRYLEWMTRNV